MGPCSAGHDEVEVEEEWGAGSGQEEAGVGRGEVEEEEKAGAGCGGTRRRREEEEWGDGQPAVRRGDTLEVEFGLAQGAGHRGGSPEEELASPTRSQRRERATTGGTLPEEPEVAPQTSLEDGSAQRPAPGPRPSPGQRPNPLEAEGVGLDSSLLEPRCSPEGAEVSEELEVEEEGPVAWEVLEVVEEGVPAAEGAEEGDPRMPEVVEEQKAAPQK